MIDDAVKKVFGDEMNASLALHLKLALDRVVFVGLEVKELGRFPDDVLQRTLGEKAAPIIKGIVRHITPEVSQNVRQIDERIIWNIYWHLRKDIEEERFSIFSVLANLNNDPLYAFVLA